uniref:Uncharacterized protein n=1 Tax=Sphaerodactylus townsendi TaxID=933632 RepID=A0ACB8F1R0_9SAUR
MRWGCRWSVTLIFLRKKSHARTVTGIRLDHHHHHYKPLPIPYDGTARSLSHSFRLSRGQNIAEDAAMTHTAGPLHSPPSKSPKKSKRDAVKLFFAFILQPPVTLR